MDDLQKANIEHRSESKSDDHDETKHEKEMKSKRNRPRRQKLYADIRKQMEFYFSDANITKNRMMKEIVQASEYVQLDIFLGFNKISALTKSLEELRKALKHSEKLELSEDRLGVKRKVLYDESKLKDEQAIENCTIYVENIPRNVGHEWVERIFQEFGSIAYISVPKFRKSGQPKGFAFVEFDEQDSADRCLEAYGSMGACLSTDIDPSNLLSVKSFEEEHHSQTGLPSVPGEASESDAASPAHEKGHTNGSSKSSSHKRKLDVIDVSDTDTDSDATRAKKTKAEHSAPDDSELSYPRKRALPEADSNHKQDEASTSKRQRQSETVSSTTESAGAGTKSMQSSSATDKTSGPAAGGTEGKKKKKRRKKKKTTHWNQAEVQLENDSIQLQILPKASWRKLRNRYLNLQRENMSKLKKQLKQRKGRVPEIREVKADRKFATKSICVKIVLKEPAESVDAFRSLINSLSPKDWFNFLKYVDYNHGETEAVVRFDGGPNAVLGIKQFFQNSIGLFKNAFVMSEEDTTAYWMSCKEKNKKHHSSEPKKLIRGKDRLTNEALKAAVHIRFDDVMDEDSEFNEREMHQSEENTTA